LDGAVYSDVDVPDALETLPERLDFLARFCAAWDFGLLFNAGTIAEIRRRGQVDPLSVYGRSKLAGEQNISAVGGDVSYSAHPLRL